MAFPWLAAATAASTTAGLLSGNKKSEGYSKGDLEYLAAQRAREIDSFSRQLAQARARYAARIPQLQKEAFNRFTPELEANLAGRGLQVSGGAFASAAARRGTELQADLETQLYGQEREDIGAVESMRSALANAQFGGQYGNISQPVSNPFSQQMGMMSANLLPYAIDELAGMSKGTTSVRGSSPIMQLPSSAPSYKPKGRYSANLPGYNVAPRNLFSYKG